MFAFAAGDLKVDDEYTDGDGVEFKEDEYDLQGLHELIKEVSLQIRDQYYFSKEVFLQDKAPKERHLIDDRVYDYYENEGNKFHNVSKDQTSPAKEIKDWDNCNLNSLDDFEKDKLIWEVAKEIENAIPYIARQIGTWEFDQENDNNDDDYDDDFMDKDSDNDNEPAFAAIAKSIIVDLEKNYNALKKEINESNKCSSEGSSRQVYGLDNNDNDDDDDDLYL